MKLVGALILTLLVGLARCQSPKARATALMQNMTLDEKIAIVHGYGGQYVGDVTPNTRLKIPALNLEDGPQGVADGVTNVTCWPASITVAASWDTSMISQWASAMAAEQRGKGTNFMLGPDINLGRVPLGGRIFEMFGEDPYLTSVLVVPSVQAIQSKGVVATAKHYINNDQEYDRTTISVEVDERTNFEVYYQPFQAAVEAGVGSIMCSYNLINGTYACENPDTLGRDLEQTMGYQGFVMSDWGATHSTVASANNGLQMQMPDAGYFGQNLLNAVNGGQVPLNTLNDMVVRILTSLYAVGIMDTPQTGSINANVRSTQHDTLSRTLAEAGTVLLKNSGILPFNVQKVTSIAVIGDDGSKDPMVHGGGSGSVIPPYIVSPLQGIQSRAPENVKVTYADSSSNTNAAAAAKAADVAVVCVNVYSSEGGDRGNLQLPNGQDALIQAVVAAQPNTIVVIHGPGAVLMPWVSSVAAVVMAFYPGQEDGNALASVLFGDTNPSGKLPVTFPVQENDWFTGNVSQYPGVNGKMYYSEKLLIGYRWYDAANIVPLFPFGHGLSYTTFTYSNLQITGSISSGLTVTVQIKNSGNVAGAEVPQLYLSFPASAGEPPKILRGFQKLSITPGALQTVTFKLGKQDVSIWDVNSRSWTAVSGTFGISIGASSRDIRLKGTFNN